MECIGILANAIGSAWMLRERSRGNTAQLDYLMSMLEFMDITLQSNVGRLESLRSLGQLQSALEDVRATASELAEKRGRAKWLLRAHRTERRINESVERLLQVWQLVTGELLLSDSASAVAAASGAHRLHSRARDNLGRHYARALAHLLRSRETDVDVVQAALDGGAASARAQWKEDPDLKKLLKSESDEFVRGYALRPSQLSVDSARMLGEGAYGRVYEGVLKGKERVAVKEIPAQNAVMMLERLVSEVMLMRSLDHPNVVKYIGWTYGAEGRPSVQIVMELVEDGDLRSWLDAESLDSEALVRVIFALLDVLVFLHSPSDTKALVVHGDLKSRNVLMTPDGVPKVCDFGTARVLHSSRSMTVGAKGSGGTLGWASPEQFRGDVVRSASDVFSFGVVMWELFTGELPWGSRSDLELMRAYENAQRLEVPSDFPRPITALLRRMWQESPERRPTLHEVRRILEEHRETLRAWLHTEEGEEASSASRTAEGEAAPSASDAETASLSPSEGTTVISSPPTEPLSEVEQSVGKRGAGVRDSVTTYRGSTISSTSTKRDSVKSATGRSSGVSRSSRDRASVSSAVKSPRSSVVSRSSRDENKSKSTGMAVKAEERAKATDDDETASVRSKSSSTSTRSAGQASRSSMKSAARSATKQKDVAGPGQDVPVVNERAIVVYKEVKTLEDELQAMDEGDAIDLSDSDVDSADSEAEETDSSWVRSGKVLRRVYTMSALDTRSSAPSQNSILKGLRSIFLPKRPKALS